MSSSARLLVECSVGSGRFFKREQDEGEIISEAEVEKKEKQKRSVIGGGSGLEYQIELQTDDGGGACESLGPPAVPGKGSSRPL